ncbi:MAG: FHA domain-containing protein [Chloroflexota bacterium]
MTTGTGRQCPHCDHINEPQAYLCANCGRYIRTAEDQGDKHDTRRVRPSPLQNTGRLTGTTASHDTDRLPGSIYLESIESNLSIRMDYEMGQFSIGRHDPVSNLTPDLDLTMFNAQKHGISRLHATLRCTTEKVFLQDLNSVNGTRLDGKTLIPGTSRQLEERHIVQFGTLALRIIIIRSSYRRG